MFELKKFTAKKQCIFKGRLIARLITTHTIGTKKENMINMIYVLNRHWSRLLCWSRHNYYLKPIYIHEYNVSIIAPTGEGFRACMIYDALHYHQSNRPINAHRELLRTLSFDRGKIKYLGWARERYICVIERRCVWQTLFLNQEPRNQFTRKFENWVPSNRPRLLPGRTRKKDEGLWNNDTIALTCQIDHLSMIVKLDARWVCWRL